MRRTSVDFGDSAMLELLLRAGANPQSKNKDGLTAIQLAAKYKYTRHQQALERVEAARTKR